MKRFMKATGMVLGGLVGATGGLLLGAVIGGPVGFGVCAIALAGGFWLVQLGVDTW